ncbi:hypothetical protein [Pleionea sp. CnH1-48]|uniref:hypothetical protein n=1 Tax=Pleionea sp. CnH1-48 TaxID=2954494 RepID=UPI00209770B0|nr:hypothetical protein [Pleionea sp. CnH1-48]MCO7224353.1 hypothetical protein [Pleionea sp. CnH1-48]
MKRQNVLFYLVFSLLAGIASAKSKTPETDAYANMIVEKIVKAYGGNKLTSVKSIEITDYNKSPWSGQSERPDQLDFFRDHSILTIDFENQRKSMLSWRVTRTGKDLDRFVFDGKRGRIYDILNRKYSNEDWLNFESLGRSVIGMSDTMIAHTLANSKEEVEHLEEANYRGSLHHKVRTSLRGRTGYILYIHKDSGLISKMTRKLSRARELVYVFSNHRQSDGITFAQDLNLFVDGKPFIVSVERNIRMNPSLEDLFIEPSGYRYWGDTFDTSKRSVRKLADGVYHIGKDRSYSLFVETDEYFIAAGGEGELKENYEAVKKLAANNKPLKYFILTHHHREHLAILNEVETMGASIITVQEHLDTIQQQLAKELTPAQFYLVKEKAEFGEGRVQVHDIATAHSEHYLLIYLPSAKIIFGEDHFETQLKTALPRVHKDMVTFRDAMEALNIEVDYLVDGHSPRKLSIADFQIATDAYKEIRCPKGYQICQNG